MENEYVIIKIKDNNNYLDNNEDTLMCQYLLKKDKDFNEKYEKLLKICKEFSNFQEVEDFIYDNFEKVNIDEREIWV